jgi:hypothetical protein
MNRIIQKVSLDREVEKLGTIKLYQGRSRVIELPAITGNSLRAATCQQRLSRRQCQCTLGLVKVLTVPIPTLRVLVLLVSLLEEIQTSLDHPFLAFLCMDTGPRIGH